MTDEPRSRVPALLIVLGVLLTLAAVLSALPGRGTPSAAPQAPAAQPAALDVLISRAQTTLRRTPADAPLWAQLGGAYVEKARITGDPSYYALAQGALDRSMEIEPSGNGEALIGLGQLANARHDFATARDLGEQARVLRPYTGAVHGVLADAYTQLGDTTAATAAIGDMLAVDPGLAAFTRASYDFELHGRVDEARSAMLRALDSALTPADVAYCRYYLGELAWNAGDVAGAAEHYAAGRAVAPQDLTLQQGEAKVAWARGRTAEAIDAYAAITARAPIPQYLLEYGELLQAAGRDEDAQAQYDVLAAQQSLLAAEGSTDDQVAAIVAADHGDPAEALRLAEAEWDRRQSVFTADALAWALYVNDRAAEALGFAERADALGWRNATHDYHRGMILAALGRTAAATDALSEALATNPYFHPLHAPIARAVLDRMAAA
ncbi:MAG: hypothetical protein NTW05_11500 [Pseudonocardiales bacterium]|nr:hypothetical protein [Pseudonocardiales bacterium]